MMLFFVGTYTRLGGPGIAVCSLEDGRLALRHSIRLTNPSYVVFSTEKCMLYAISSETADGRAGGSVVAYHWTGTQLVARYRFDTGAAGPCHLCLSPDERFLYTAQYQSGTLSVFPLDPPDERIQLIKHQGKGLHPERQQGPHVHQVSFQPATQRLIAVDLGLDALVCYQQDRQSGLLSEEMRWSCQPGLGPRHLTYASDHQIYLLHELGNAVSALRLNGQTFTHLQTLPTLPPEWRCENTGAAIRTNGRYVFTSNRGHDSIAVFRIWAGGRLQPVGYFSCGGSIPRDFYLLPDRQILVANQDGSVVLMYWDEEKETIRPSGSTLDLAGAVCICPLIIAAPAGQGT